MSNAEQMLKEMHGDKMPWEENIPPKRIVIAIDLGMRTEEGREYTHAAVREAMFGGFDFGKECVIDGIPGSDTLYEVVKMLVLQIEGGMYERM